MQSQLQLAELQLAERGVSAVAVAAKLAEKERMLAEVSLQLLEKHRALSYEDSVTAISEQGS